MKWMKQIILSISLLFFTFWTFYFFRGIKLKIKKMHSGDINNPENLEIKGKNLMLPLNTNHTQ